MRKRSGCARLPGLLICLALVAIAILLIVFGRNDMQRTAKLYHEHQAELVAQRDQLFAGPMEELPADQLTQTLWRRGNGRRPSAVRIGRYPVFICPTCDYGDLYRNFYWYGLVWTESPDVFPEDPALTVQPVENGWYVYRVVLPQ